MTLPAIIARLIDERRLVSHPEGGWYREIRRADEIVATLFGERPVETVIEYLLAAGQVSRLHRLRQDETWTLLAGPGLDLHLLAPGGVSVMHRLAAGAETVTVPAGVWMGAETPAGWALVSCACRPGFAFADLEFSDRETLLAAWPQCASAIGRLNPPSTPAPASPAPAPAACPRRQRRSRRRARD